MSLPDRWKSREEAIERIKQKLIQLDEQEAQLNKEEARRYLEQEKMFQEQHDMKQELLQLGKEAQYKLKEHIQFERKDYELLEDIKDKIRLIEDKIVATGKQRVEYDNRRTTIEKEVSLLITEYKKLYSDVS
jgi:chromosome segregation ATPase